jgi:Flp pilus assembly protein TadD
VFEATFRCQNKKKWARAIGSLALLALGSLTQVVLVKAQSLSQQKSTQLSAQEVFRRVSSAVFVVEALDYAGSVVAFGSGVVALGPTQLITNWHVVEEAAGIRVRRGDETWPATVSRCNVELDLCQLYVPSLDARPVPSRLSSTLHVGERVYAIGAPEGLELTFSEGIVSGLRDSPGQGRIIQTTAPLSHGSSGGGLFDAQGRLVGITSFAFEEGQNLNFAMPTDSIRILALGTDESRKAGRKPVTRQPADPKHNAAAAHRERGLSLLYDQHDSYGAIAELRTAVALDPNDTLAHEALGEALLRVGDLDGATAETRALLKLDPNNPEAYRLIGDMLMAKGNDWLNRSQAITAYRRAVQLAPRNSLYRLSLADALKETGDRDEAIKEYRELIRLECLKTKTEFAKFFCASYHVSIGDILRDKGELDGAVDEYRTALDLDDLSSAHYGIGKVLLDKGDAEGAFLELRQAVDLLPSKAHYHHALCVALERKGYVQKAMAECRAAYLLNPKNAEIRANFERLLQKSKE